MFDSSAHRGLNQWLVRLAELAGLHRDLELSICTLCLSGAELNVMRNETKLSAKKEGG